MDRYWLLTWTTYGTWLPGDRRGFVSNVRAGPGPEVRHNEPGTPCDVDLPGLERSARQALKGSPVYLTAPQAQLLLEQFKQTATYRGWALLAVAVMANHVHLVVGVAGDPEPAQLLASFKSYGSRALNRTYTKPPGGTWWTESGSRRKLSTPEAVIAAIAYVERQTHALTIWIGERGAFAP